MSGKEGDGPSVPSAERVINTPPHSPVIGLSFGEIDPLLPRGNGRTPTLIGRTSIEDIMMQPSGSQGLNENSGVSNGKGVTVFEFSSGEGS